MDADRWSVYRDATMASTPRPAPIVAHRQVVVGFALAGAVALLWSGWMVVSRVGATHALFVSDVTLLRFAGAGLLLLPLFVRRWPEIRQAGWRPLLVLGIMGGAPYSFVSVGGMAFAPTAQGAVVMPGALALFATLLAWGWLGERPHRDRWAGLALVAVALALIGIEGAENGTWQGYALFVLAALMWAAFTVGTRVYGLRPLTNVAVISVTSLVWYVPLVTLFDSSAIPTAPWQETALQLWYQGLMAGVLAPMMYTRAIQTIGPQRAALVMVLVPVLATLMAWALLGEAPGRLTIAGMVLVLPGMALAAGAVSLRRRIK